MEQIYNYFENNPIEILGAVLTLVCVFCNIRQNWLGWFFGIASIICYIYVFFKALLIGDFLLNIYFLISCIYGFWQWKFGSTNRSELAVSALSNQNFVKIMVLGAFLSLIFGKLFSTYPDASVPYWDAIPTAYSMIAQILLARKKIENWLLWIFVNTFSVGIYFYKELYASTILYFILWIMAFQGYFAWKKELKNSLA